MRLVCHEVEIHRDAYHNHLMTELPYKVEVNSGAFWGGSNLGSYFCPKGLLQVNPEIFSCLSTEKVRSSLCTHCS